MHKLVFSVGRCAYKHIAYNNSAICILFTVSTYIGLFIL
jgi:hypothetical protein